MRSHLPILLFAGLALSCSSGSDEQGQGGHSEEEHASAVLHLSPEQLDAAGIRVQAVGPGKIERRLRLPATVELDADAVMHVNPKASGLVRAVHKHLGQKVARNDLLCEVDSVELGGAVAEERRARAMVAAAEETLAKEGALFEQRLATAAQVLDGAIAVAAKIHEQEKKLRAQEVSTIRPLLEADKALQSAKLAKEKELMELRAQRDARLLALDVSLREKRIQAEAARSLLLALGVSAAALDDPEQRARLRAGTYEIRAARAGIITTRHITLGEHVDSETRLYTIEDRARVWVIASAFEEQLRSVRRGQEAVVHLDAFPGRSFAARVALVGYEVDATSRALGVRVELDNEAIPEWGEEFPIRPGMFGSVELVLERREAPLTLPESAIVHEGGANHVFVQSDAETFERRAVQIAPGYPDVVEILAGLEAGERVAVEGSFLLKSLARRDELGEGHEH